MTGIGDLAEENEAESVARAFGGERKPWAILLHSAVLPDSAFNRAAMVRAPEGEVDRVVDAITAFYRGRTRAPAVQVTGATRPVRLAEILRRRGFREVSQDSVMVLEGPPGGAPNPAVTVRHATPEDAEAWVSVNVEAFGISLVGSAPYRGAMVRALRAGAFRFYLALLDGSPVGTMFVLPHRGVVGVYAVGTMGSARRRGVATTLLHRAYRDGRALHEGPIVLQCVRGSVAERLYRNLGFRPLWMQTRYVLHG